MPTGHRWSDEKVARVAHAAIAELHSGEKCPPLPFGCQDPEEQLIGAEAVRALRAGATVSEHHNQWVQGKLDLGWRRGVKNYAGKTHPDLMPFDELAPERRDAAMLFVMIVTALTVAG